MSTAQAQVREDAPVSEYAAETSPEMLDLETARVLRPLLDLELPEEDGIPMESNWHRKAMNVLIDSVYSLWHDRSDFFAGGNMFIHYSLDLVRQKDFLGPDVFVVKNVDGTRDRGCWTVWKEGGRYPDVIVELASPSTMKIDLGKKKEIYERTFHTPEYFCYDPGTQQLQGWQLAHNAYIALQPDEHGRLWSEELQAWIGLWEGNVLKLRGTWLRLYTAEKELVPTLAEAEARRAEAEALRASNAEAENARLMALLARHGISDKAE
ncbi:MAG: Uma2 family endonuclease [bacterium]|nr:Uma2 family endonuclease [bacterium]